MQAQGFEQAQEVRYCSNKRREIELSEDDETGCFFFFFFFGLIDFTAFGIGWHNLKHTRNAERF